MDSTKLQPHWPLQPLHALSNLSPALAAAVALAVILPMLLSWATAGRSIPKIKSSKSWFATRQDFAAHGVEIIEKGFNQVKSGVFRVTAQDGELFPLARGHPRKKPKTENRGKTKGHQAHASQAPIWSSSHPNTGCHYARRRTKRSPPLAKRFVSDSLLSADTLN